MTSFAQEFQVGKWYVTQSEKAGNQVLNFVRGSGDSLIFNQMDGSEIIFLPQEIVKSEPISKAQAWNLSNWPLNPINYRSFVFNNGKPMPKGLFEYNTHMGYIHQVQYGFSSHFSLAAGSGPYFLQGKSETPFWLSPLVNFSFPKKIYLSLGTNLVFPNQKHASKYWIHRAVLTKDLETWSVSIGVAMNQYFDYPAINRFLFYASSGKRISRRTSFLIECLADPYDQYPGYYGIVGFRTMGKYFSFDYGLSGFINRASDPTEVQYWGFLIPWLGFSFRLPVKK